MFRVLSNLLSRLGLITISAIGTGGGFIVIFLFNQTIDPRILKVTAVAGIGIISGFSARWLLNKSMRLFRFLSAWTCMLLSLLFLGIVTNGYFGFTVFSSNTIPISSDELFQFLLGGAVAWLSLNAWRASRSSIKPPVGLSPKKKRTSTQKKRRSIKTIFHKPKKKIQPSSSQKGIRLNIAIREYWQKLLPRFYKKGIKVMTRTTSTYKKPKRKLNGFQKLSIKKSRLPLRIIRQPLSLSRRLFKIKKKPEVSLIGAEEHRCPYCLEVVEPNDPRGIVICSICGTYHHADCWEVTGTCQVPHNQE